MNADLVSVVLSFLGKVQRIKEVKQSDIQWAVTETGGDLDSLITTFIRLAASAGNEDNLPAAKALYHVATRNCPPEKFRERLVDLAEKTAAG